ncbi:uncharacterized protein LOC143198553 [Rhynchophorus ferrugineus]|uniref:uncharacterized protein LOC143198553 n=1 Tax=Rhynchophorus ferrugineus TaxID=354439 RepID=UPI003FCE22FC
MDITLKTIPDSILDNLICRNCCSYLTILPITVSPEGHYLCGRCLTKKSTTTPDSMVIQTSTSELDTIDCTIPMILLAYGTFQSIFPCINKYEGCSQHLTLDEIPSHEKKCVFRKTKCHRCEFYGVGTQLVNHFQYVHNQFYRNKACFTLKDKNQFENRFLYAGYNVLLLVSCLFSTDDGQMTVQVRGVTEERISGVLRINFGVKRDGRRDSRSVEVVSRRFLLNREDCYDISFQIGDCFGHVDWINCSFMFLS